MSDKRITKEYLQTLDWDDVIKIWRDMHDTPKTVAEYCEMARSIERDLVLARMDELRPQRYSRKY